MTGGAGFIGTHLCRALRERGDRVVSIDNYVIGSTTNHLDGVEYNFGHTKDMARVVPQGADVVFHLGEYSRVERSFTEPGCVWDLNLAGTSGVLEYWRANRCRLVYAGSSTKFADGGNGEGLAPYAFTKAVNSRAVQHYSRWFDLPYATAYFYNVYGPGEWAGKYGTLLGIFSAQKRRGLPLTVTAPGTQRRIWTHVDDIVAGLLLLAERGDGDGYGLGSSDEFSVLEIAEMFKAAVVMGPPAQGNRMDVSIDRSKAEALGWVARKNVQRYIEDLCDAAKKVQ